jgi:hypothetical protein
VAKEQYSCHGVSQRGGSAEEATMRFLLLIIVIILLIGALPAWPYSAGWGYYPSGGLGLVVIILLILLLMGRI